MKTFFKKYLDNNCSEGEFRSFIDLFVRPEKQRELDANMKEDWTAEKKGDVPDLSGTLYRIHYEINKQEKKHPFTRKIVSYMTRVAAVLLIPVAIAYVIQLRKDDNASSAVQTISTPLASKTSFLLPDGSSVWLNAGSAISFSNGLSGGERVVTLKGEAYFDVKKDSRPFVVKTSLCSVNVLGTAFNVMAYDHEAVAVTLERGRISLETKSNHHETLVPGQQALVDTVNQLVSLRQVDTSLFSSWIRNQLIFKNEPLGNVVRRLERWYNINIVVTDKSLLKIPMTASIEFESIREVMELMKLTLPVNYEYKKNNRQLIVYKRND